MLCGGGRSSMTGNSFFSFFFFFFNLDHLKVFIEFVTILLQLFIFWFFSPEMCGILAPKPGIKSDSLHWEGEVSTTGLSGNSWQSALNLRLLLFFSWKKSFYTVTGQSCNLGLTTDRAHFTLTALSSITFLIITHKFFPPSRWKDTHPLPLSAEATSVVKIATILPSLAQVFPPVGCLHGSPRQNYNRSSHSTWYSISSACLQAFLCVCVSQSCLILCNPMDHSPPVSCIHGTLQGRILEWVAIPFSRGSSQPRDRTQVTYTAGRFYTVWATRENCLQRLPAWCCWSLPRAVSDISWRLNIESWSLGERGQPN